MQTCFFWLSCGRITFNLTFVWADDIHRCGRERGVSVSPQIGILCRRQGRQEWTPEPSSRCVKYKVKIHPFLQGAVESFDGDHLYLAVLWDTFRDGSSNSCTIGDRKMLNRCSYSGSVFLVVNIRFCLLYPVGVILKDTDLQEFV